MKDTPWQNLFTQLLSMAEAQTPEAPIPAEAVSLAKRWEASQSQLEQGPLAEDYHQYYESTQQDTRDAQVDLIDQQEWYNQLQQVQLFVQDVLHQSS